MKIITVLLLVLAGLNTNTANAQINIPADSINTILCHKWSFSAILMDGQRMPNLDAKMTYHFFADGTVKRLNSDGKTESGTWVFKTEQKIILLKIKKAELHIPVLSKDELIVMIGDGSTRDALGIGTILMPASN